MKTTVISGTGLRIPGHTFSLFLFFLKYEYPEDIRLYKWLLYTSLNFNKGYFQKIKQIEEIDKKCYVNLETIQIRHQETHYYGRDENTEHFFNALVAADRPLNCTNDP